MTMLNEERKPNGDIVFTLKTDATKVRTEAYIIEVITQKLADAFVARYGERIIADIDIESIRANIEYEVHNVLRDHKDISALRREGGNKAEDQSKRTGGGGETDVFTGL